MARSFKRPDEAAMQRVFARTSGGAAEVVLRLAWLQGLHRAEITALRWDQVDFAGRALLLPDRTIPLDPSAEACLRAWYVRCAGNPECVAVSDRDQTSMRPESVSRLARQALNSEGLALCLLDLRRDFILRQIEVHGWSHAAQVSGVAAAALREEFLPRLRAANTLPEAPKVGRDERYYPAGAVTPPEEQLAVIQTYLREHGSGRRQDFLRLLNVSPAQGTQILRRLTARGELILTGRRYTLPKGE